MSISFLNSKQVEKLLLPFFNSNAKPFIRSVFKAIHKKNYVEYIRALNNATTEFWAFPGFYGMKPLLLIKYIPFESFSVFNQRVYLYQFRKNLTKKQQSQFDEIFKKITQ